jgi:hypothetical protein
MNLKELEMNSLITTFEIPFEVLEEKYWQGGGFCLCCEQFSLQKVEPALDGKCPLCGEDAYYDVDFLIKKEIFISID